MFISIVVICALIGALVGFLAGLLGIGGGLIIVPALAIILPMQGVAEDVVMPIALATSLSSIVVTSMIASLSHAKNNNIPWNLTKTLMVFVAIGAFSGGFIADLLSSKSLTIFFAVAVIILASYMLASLKIPHQKDKKLPSNNKVRFVGSFTGVMASLMGISGGAILIPILTFFNVNLRHAIGVSSVCGFMVAFFGTFAFLIAGIGHEELPKWSLGYIYLPALMGIILTSTVFAPLGVKMAAKLPVRTIKKIFAAFLILVAIKMVIN